MSIYRMSKHGTYLLKNDRKLYNWINESDEIADLLNNLTEENEQLKNMIKEAYNNERTTLGRNVLKQLIEQME